MLKQQKEIQMNCIKINNMFNKHYCIILATQSSQLHKSILESVYSLFGQSRRYCRFTFPGISKSSVRPLLIYKSGLYVKKHRLSRISQLSAFSHFCERQSCSHVLFCKAHE
jgi:hypothetical protein